MDGPNRSPWEVDAAVRELVREMNLTVLRNEQAGPGREQQLDPPAADRLGELRMPVLVGEQDQPALLDIARMLADDIPDARMVLLEEIAHLPNMERPEEFNRFVLEFLEEL